ncbi:MAG: Pr6Pr family membrane protein [Puia sp.]|nr:Pr6Pr family membrane protein [Puia sp.]
MEKNQSLSQQIFQVTGAILGWLAVLGQLYLIILNRTESVGETIIRFFSFFTILTNILVALCFTACLVNKDAGFFAAFARPSNIAAITVYITVVGLIYNLILRSLWDPTGLQLIVNELLHSVIPVLFVVFWLIFIPKTGLTIKKIVPWLVFPLIYMLFVIFRGALSGFYPYPFIDVRLLGYPRSFFNAALCLCLFLVLSLLILALGNLLNKRKSPL